MSKINITFKGKKYEIDKSLLSGAISSLEGAFEELEGGSGEDESVVGTWVFNDVIECPPIEIGAPMHYELKFTATDYEGFVHKLDILTAYRSEEYFTLSYYNEDETVCIEDVYDDGWNIVECQTITITEEPTDPEFVAWLKANAVKVEIEYIPEGGVYTAADGTVYNAGDAFPMIATRGDMYRYGDYEYCYGWRYCGDCEDWSHNCGDNLETSGWRVRCIDVAEPDVMVENIGGRYITSIEETFSRCESLTTVPKIPDSVTSIGYQAFYNCSSLTSVTIPDSVMSIGERAFMNCSSLTSVTIPDSVTSIGNYAFYDCSSLTDITVDVNNEYYCSIDGNLYNEDGTKLIQYAIGKTDISFEIPDSVTSIGACAFMNCSSLTSVTIPDSVTSIGDEAFMGCSRLTSIEIPDSVTSIGEWAFCDCSSLESITIPDSVTSIGYQAFKNCSSLTSIEIPDSVTSIGYEAFKNCSSLTSIEIPDSVTSIGNYAFEDCSGLTSVVIGDSVTSIGRYAFCDCSSLTSVTFNGTIAQWNAIIKGSNWHSKVPATHVTCSDGQAEL